MTDHADNSHVMPCMEVWGGNRAVDSGVVMAGLDAWVFSRPFRDEDQGGDVHYVSSCATGRVTRLLVADVSGHGESVAEVSTNLRLLMRRYVNHINQNSFIEALNREFASLSSDGGFATALVATYFAPNSYFTLANAGHPPPLYYSRKKKAWRFLAYEESTVRGLANVPLGIDEIAQYDEDGMRLDVGDLVLFYTDSLTEARDESGEMLGMSGLLDVVRELDLPDPQDLITRLLNEIAKRYESNLTGDDVTVLLFRPNGLAPRVPFVRRVLAPIRVMFEVARSLVTGNGSAPWPEFSMSSIGGAFLTGLNRKGREADELIPKENSGN